MRVLQRRGETFTWREFPEPPHYPLDCVLLPSGIVSLLVDPNYVKTILRTDQDNIDHQRQRILTHGFDQPLLVVYDEEGHIKLKDGNHRLQAALQLEVPYVPVAFKASKGRVKGKPLSTIIEPLLIAIAKKSITPL